jgi:hypothetical protein
MAKNEPKEASKTKPILASTGPAWVELFAEGDADKIRGRLRAELSSLLKKWSRRLQRYNVVFYYQPEPMTADDTDDIYRALKRNLAGEKDVFMLLVAYGGQPQPAYQISKLCRDWTKDRFIVGVPRYAYSAATLVCLGADAVHMGPLGNLGPVDAMYSYTNGQRVSGMAHIHSLQTITRWVTESPASQGFWAEILSNDSNFAYFDIGYYEREEEASVQWAERLLIAGKSDPDRAAKIAKYLTYEYKNHGFVIDRDEATDIFGADSVVRSSNELAFSEEAYDLIASVDKGLRAIEPDGNNIGYGGVKVVGTVDDIVLLPPPVARKRKKSQDSEHDEQPS